MASNKQHFPFPNDGWSKDGRATATCFCAAVQLSFVRLIFNWKQQSFWQDNMLTLRQPTEGDGLVDTFLCNCTDCKPAISTLPLKMTLSI